MGELINQINVAEKAVTNLGGRPIRAPWRCVSEGNLMLEKQQDMSLIVIIIKIECRKVQCDLCY